MRPSDVDRPPGIDRRDPGPAGGSPEPREPTGDPDGPPPQRTPLPVQPARYGRYVGLLALVILVFITINTILTKPNGATGIPPGETVPPFAVPLADGTLKGAADVATRPNEGSSGRVPACRLRGPEILNICELYERGPVVLALFIAAGSCPAVLADLQSIAPSFPQVRFAAVAMRSDRTAVRRLIARGGLTFPVGLDEDGRLAALYRLATCPQLTFISRGGAVQSRALLSRPSRATLRQRVAELAAASQAAARAR